MTSQGAARTLKEAFETAENGFVELSDGRLREKNPLTDALGRPVPAWGPVAMLADLLND